MNELESLPVFVFGKTCIEYIESSRMSGFKCADFHKGGWVLLPGENRIQERNQEITMP